jgi:hypothetical protein
LVEDEVWWGPKRAEADAGQESSKTPSFPWWGGGEI